MHENAAGLSAYGMVCKTVGGLEELMARLWYAKR